MAGHLLLVMMRQSLSLMAAVVLSCIGLIICPEPKKLTALVKFLWFNSHEIKANEMWLQYLLWLWAFQKLQKGGIPKQSQVWGVAWILPHCRGREWKELRRPIKVLAIMSLKQLKYLTGSRKVPNMTPWGAHHWCPHKQHPPQHFWKISWIISQHNYYLENDNAKPTLQWLGCHHRNESHLLPQKEPLVIQSLAEDFCCVSQGCQVSHWDRAMSSNEDWWFRM